MEFKDFAKEHKRMCVAHPGCNGCELEGRSCTIFVLENPDEAERIVSEWSKEHPIKTRRSEFLKLFPNAPQSLGETLCPCNVDVDFNCNYNNMNCYECKRAYWLSELEGGETK